MQQLAGNRLAEAEVMFLPEFDHAPNGFHSRRLFGVGRVPCGRPGGALHEGEEVLFQGHAAGPCLRQETASTSGLRFKVTVIASSNLLLYVRLEAGASRWHCCHDV